MTLLSQLSQLPSLLSGSGSGSSTVRCRRLLLRGWRLLALRHAAEQLRHVLPRLLRQTHSLHLPPTRGSWAAAASAPSASAAFAWPAFLSLRRLARAGRQRRRGAERRRRRRQRPAATRRAGPHQRRARGRAREPPLACTCQKPVQLRKSAVSEGICLLCPARLRARCGPHGRRKPKTRCPSDARSARTRARAVARPRRATRTDDWRWECCVRQDHCGRPFLPPPRCEWVGFVAKGQTVMSTFIRISG